MVVCFPYISRFSLRFIDRHTRIDFGKEFMRIHKKEFQFLLPRDILVDDVRVRGIGLSNEARKSEGSKLYAERQSTVTQAVNPTTAASVAKVYFEETGRVDTPIYLLGTLPTGTVIKGPAIIIDDVSSHSPTSPHSSCSILHLVSRCMIDPNTAGYPWSYRDQTQLSRCHRRWLGREEESETRCH